MLELLVALANVNWAGGLSCKGEFLSISQESEDFMM